MTYTISDNRIGADDEKLEQLIADGILMHSRYSVQDVVSMTDAGIMSVPEARKALDLPDINDAYRRTS